MIEPWPPALPPPEFQCRSGCLGCALLAQAVQLAEIDEAVQRGEASMLGGPYR